MQLLSRMLFGMFNKNGTHPTWTAADNIKSVTPSVQGSGFGSLMVLFTIEAQGVLAMKENILEEMRCPAPMTSTEKTWLQTWDDQIRAAAKATDANIPGFLNGRCTSVADISLWVPTAVPT